MATPSKWLEVYDYYDKKSNFNVSNPTANEESSSEAKKIYLTRMLAFYYFFLSYDAGWQVDNIARGARELLEVRLHHTRPV